MVAIYSHHVAFPFDDSVFVIFIECSIDLLGVITITAISHEVRPFDRRVNLATFQVPRWTLNPILVRCRGNPDTDDRNEHFE